MQITNFRAESPVFHTARDWHVLIGWCLTYRSEAERSTGSESPTPSVWGHPVCRMVKDLMRIGLINQLNGRPNGDRPSPSWASISEQAQLAEAVGFDMFVFEDALLYRDKEHTNGLWESVSIAGALAATTDTIRIGQSVVNSPYRSPAMMASVATTLDEISGGRYILGIGAGNTEDSDYEAFGFPTDRRYSRFAEAIQIIHSLLKTGTADFTGQFYTVKRSELVLRGPSQQGPPINIAAGGEKMITLVARYGDQWNWWGHDETIPQTEERFKPIIETLERACQAEGRDPGSLIRTFDLYSVLAPGLEADHGMTQPVTGSPEEIAGHILSLGELGFEEVRCDVWPKTTDAVAAMEPVVELVHRG
jgi:alkanesulfonate monooxygenase SsuD/methylene tetrahydromethanopterin reductase-like flavin-dependent oxidoreductase (luciferase family)